MAIKWMKREINRNNSERIDYFLREGYEPLAFTFAKIVFLERHPYKKFPDYYEDNTKGHMLGLFEHPDVMAGGQKILDERKKKLDAARAESSAGEAAL